MQLTQQNLVSHLISFSRLAANLNKHTCAHDGPHFISRKLAQRSVLRKRLGLPLRTVYKVGKPQEEQLMRTAKIARTTAETEITVALNLDGTGRYDNKTGVGFFDHMLDQLARHAMFDLTIRVNGDHHIDDHHTVEDTGIALGQALTQAVGDKKGIQRYGSCLLPMDDALVRCALDLSARPYLVWGLDLPTERIGAFDIELLREFFQALSTHGGVTLHLDQLHGLNSHHIAEATFKAVACALREAVEMDPRSEGRLPSTKGAL
jgi:imidazoleglycerol-phosphate dehydratase